MSAIKTSDDPRAVAVEKLDKARAGDNTIYNTGLAVAAGLIYIGDELQRANDIELNENL